MFIAGNMKRDKRVQAYVSSELADEIDTLADQQEMTRSEYIATVLSDHVYEETLEQSAEAQNAERRLEALIADGRDELLDILDSSDDAITASAAASIATWEVLKGAYGPKERKEAIQNAKNRLNEDCVKLGIDPDVIADGMDDEPITDSDTTHPRSQHDQGSQQSDRTDNDDDEFDTSWDFS
jgi:metal-responsive CopG/Arc/MetJ family transcriptional regulator